MSLNKTLDRLFDEIRREAKRNPDFADRLDAVLRLHDSRRDVADGVVEDVAGVAPSPAVEPPPAPAAEAPKPKSARKVVAEAPAIQAATALSPFGLYKRDGADGLKALLVGQELGALRAMVAEHNLDPGGVTASLTRDELADHVVAQARRRAERDDKMFDY